MPDPMPASCDLIEAVATTGMADPRAVGTLDGRPGGNRARGGVCQLSADTDLEAVRAWLAEYANSPHTLRSYRKEV